MKKLGKLTLKELSNETVEIIQEELRALIGGGVVGSVWNSWNDNQRAQYIFDTYRNGGAPNIQGLSATGWSTGQCGANITVNGNNYTVMVSLSPMGNDIDLSQLGYYQSNVYQNQCGYWTQGYVGGFGSNTRLMMNPTASQASNFYYEFN